VPSPYFNPPRHLVKEWPEIFEDMQINTLPVAYLEYVHLEFANGRVWQIDIKSQLQEQEAEVVATRLLDTMSEYRAEIVKLDFKIDIEKLKKDIRDSSKKIL
jgi:nicotinamide mononucleotide adenylyltransferase